MKIFKVSATCFSLLLNFLFLLNTTYATNEKVAEKVAESSDPVIEEHYEGKGSVYAEDLAEAGKFLNHFDTKAEKLMNKNALANWDYETDLTDDKLQKTIDIGLDVSDFFLKSSENASQIKTLDLPNRIQRQISWIRRSADPTSDQMRREIKETIGKMTSIFGKGKVQKKSKNYTINDLTDILRSSKKRSELDWAWKSWRDTVGPPIKALYGNLVDLLNIGAREHGWIDYGNYLRSDYEMGDDFEPSLDEVWNLVEPLYQELHAYVRYKLASHYKFKKNACIPANVLGDMFAQNWENIFHLVKPSKNSKTFDVTKALKNQKFTVKKMFRLAEKFFVSLGLSKMPKTFWDKSVFVKPKNKEMVCHASAWDVSSSDVRIKMCTKVRQSDLTTVHHEMGHIEYYLQYKDQPSTFRAGANPGFHEAIGDTISLSVETSNYLNEIGLLKTESMDQDTTISFLLNQALRRVAPLPYNLLVDKWRWRVYEGNITENAYNKEWWKLRVRYQGVEPPVMRPATSFDPASKYHIGANSPYISYFVSYVLQFQLHKAFCKAAGHKGALHECSIYKSEVAGKKLKKMLEAGRSQPWPRILKEATGERDLKASAILEYFDPLVVWLKEQRKAKKYPLGWKNKMSTQVMQKRTKKYEAGQERSGILKTNSGDVSLSINIPSLALKDILGKGMLDKDIGETKLEGKAKLKSGNETAGLNKDSKDKSDKPDKSSASATKDKDNDKSDKSTSSIINGSKDTTKDSPLASATADLKPKEQDAPKTLDLAKLLTSGSPVSIKSTETSTMGEKGNTEKSIKEIAIDTLGSTDEKAKLNNELSEKTVASLISALKGAAMNNSIGLDNTPLATAERPLSKFPVMAASPNEIKSNPMSAGIASVSNNPSSAGVAQVPKPNYVPSNQIALVPISLPASVLSQLQGAMNGTAAGNSTSSLSSLLQPFANVTGDSAESEVAKILKTSLRNETVEGSKVSGGSVDPWSNSSSNTDTERTALKDDSKETESKKLNGNEEKNEKEEKEKETSGIKGSSNTNDTQLSDSESSKLKPERNESSTAAMDSQPYAAAKNQSGMVVVIPQLNEASNIQSPKDDKSDKPSSYISKQTVSPCKRSNGAPCYEGKVITEGNSLQFNPKETISISPSMLIQKLIEHKEAEKSTPEPVVNATPDDLNKEKKTREEPTGKTGGGGTEVDIGRLIKALTGSSTNPTDGISNDTTSSGREKEGSNEKKVGSETTASNCSTARKRGISLNFDCPGEKHKGGSLSISPNELLQRLLGPKSKSDADKKTLPSAHVVKTPNGFQLNFDLNTKDKIPADFSVKMTNPQGRQQHVDVLNTPKGMVVKPKSSLQLLTPLFVPVQNKDIVELGKESGR